MATGGRKMGERNMLQAGLAGGRAWLAENWRNTVIDVNQLPRQLRWLTIAGYGIVAVLLVLVIVLELIGAGLPQVVFAVRAFEGEDITGRVPYLVLGLFGVCNALGWAFILTGASDCRRRVFIPVVTVFVLQWLITISNVESEDRFFSLIDMPLFCLVLLFLLLFLFTRRLAIWSRYPLIEFGFWVTVMGMHMLMVGLSGESWAGTADSLLTVVTGLVLVAAPFWFWLGIDAADAVKEYAYSATHRLQLSLTPTQIRRIVPALMAVLVVAGVALVLINLPYLVVAVLVLPCLLIVSLLLFVMRRWTTTAAVRLFWVTIVVAIYSVFVILAIEGSDINEVVLGTAGLIPAPVIFTVLLLYDVMTFGTRAASQDTPMMPLSGRLLMYLGVVMLTVGFTVVMFNVRAAGSNELVGGFKSIIETTILLSLVVLGPLYLIRVFWQSRHDMVVKQAESLVSTSEEPPIAT
jgi:hypothetical protein